MKIATGLLIPLVMLGGYAVAQQESPRNETTASSDRTAADNAKNNQNPVNRAQTADKQPNNAADLQLAKRIRQEVIADKTLSTYGHNVKIVAVNGTVTLNGVVHSADEKARIAHTSTAIAGAGHVVDELKIAPE